MQGVRHLGFTIAVEHPALWVERAERVDRGQQIVRDLVQVFTHPRISPACLRYLLANRQRLIRGHYEAAEGHGCLMFLLTEPLGDYQVRSKVDLVRLFGQSRGIYGLPGYVAAKDSPEYQPAKWLVRLIDGQICEHVRRRYGRACELFDYDLVLAVAAQLLVQREGVGQTFLCAVK